VNRPTDYKREILPLALSIYVCEFQTVRAPEYGALEDTVDLGSRKYHEAEHSCKVRGFTIGIPHSSFA